MRRHLVLPCVVAFAFVAGGCTSDATDGKPPDTSFSAQMASTDHWAGAPQLVEVGIFASDRNGIRVVTQGSIDLSFAYLGADGSGTPEAGPTASATFIPVPGTAASGDAPTTTAGTRGVYGATDVVFDSAGLWQVTASADIDGVARTLRATFPVAEKSPIPAPGQRALRTENLTIRSKGVPDSAIDSMAEAGNGIPDAELHRWTIAGAIKEHRPALVLFGTPAHCESQFCGPEVTELQRLAAAFPDKAVYIHVEIWKDFNATPQVVNKGAADWLLRTLPDGTPTMTEPWLYLIGSDGIIADRWGPLFDTSDVEAALRALPSMKP